MYSFFELHDERRSCGSCWSEGNIQQDFLLFSFLNIIFLLVKLL